MKVLITGGAGYIGSLAVKKALANKHEVVVVDDLSTGFLEALTGLDIKFYNVDIRDKESLFAVFAKEKVDIVMDFAARLVVEEGQAKPDEYYDVNVNGLKNVLDAMVEYNVNKIIFSSTAAVYGLLDKKTELIVETDPTVPSNVYGNTKLVGELMIQDYANRFGIDYLIFRYFNVVGNVKYGITVDQLTTIVPVIINAINTDTKMYVNGGDYDTRDGSPIRDFIHIEDLVDAHIVGMENLESTKKGIYNLSVGNGTSILELITLTNKELDTNIKYEIGPRREGDPVVSAASNEKFMKEFSWEINYPNVGLMIEETYNAWDEYTKSKNSN